MKKTVKDSYLTVYQRNNNKSKFIIKKYPQGSLGIKKKCIFAPAKPATLAQLVERRIRNA